MNINVPKTMSRDLMINPNIDDYKINLSDYYERNNLLWEAQDKATQQCGVKILNPIPYLCDDKYCYGSKNGRPLYFDDNHLSEYGNKLLVPMFKEIFKKDKVSK
ncbi:MAG TPA: hypothetical protein ENK66_01390 [Arcobacter sp.]|nr:hypothetical protein [Arcobacter sp.]